MPRTKTTTVTVSADGCTITLRHRIYFSDADSFNPNFADQVADAKRRIAATWCPSGGFMCGECRIVFEFEYLKAEDGAVRDDVDAKHIFGTEGTSHQTGLGPERRPGAWFGGDKQSLPEAPHEVGHELGMTDKYRFVEFDPSAPADETRWKEVPDPRGVGRGSNPTLPPNVKSVPKVGYPADGLGFSVNGTPKPADLDEILAANGAVCNCKKPGAAGRDGAARERRSEARARRDERKAAPADKRRGDERRPSDEPPARIPFPVPWQDTAVPDPPAAPERRDDSEELPRLFGEELDADPDAPPLVFIPGVMGSALAAGGGPVWPPDSTDFVKQILAMIDASVVKTATGLTPGVYEPLIAFIESPKPKGLGRTRPVNFEIYPYDWTRTCRTTGREFAAFLSDFLKRVNVMRESEGKPPFESVDVIAHSFGGLVTRIAKRLGGPVGKQVFMGTPHRGSPKAYFTLHPQVSYSDSLGVIRNWATKVLLWWNKKLLPNIPTREELFYRIALATESAMECMPDGSHLGDYDLLKVDGFKQGTWQAAYLGDPLNGPWSFPPVLDATISDAMSLKAAMGPAPAPPFRNIVSTRHKTPSDTSYASARRAFGRVVWTKKSGDATVMTKSASAGGDAVTVNQNHSDLPNEQATHDAIKAYLG